MIHEERQFHTGEVSGIERRWVWVFGLLVMIVTTIPYLIGYNSQGADWEFTGFVFGVEDGNSYIAKMLTGADGAWLFRTPYTSFQQNGIIAFFTYILIGKLTANPGQHEQLVALFHTYRFVAGLLAIHATYGFVAYYITHIWLRRLGLALATLGGGLGWLLVILGESEILGSLPLEFYSPETFGFLSLYGIAHLNLSRAAFFWGLTTYLKSLNKVDEIHIYQVVKFGGYWLLVALVQPITAVVLPIVIGLHLLSLYISQAWILKSNRLHLGWKKIFKLSRFVIIAGLFPAPLILYNVWIHNRDPFFMAWQAQSIVKSPHPLHYVFAYGVMIPLAYMGGKRLIKNLIVPGLLPVAWVISLPLLVYYPSNFQRRMSEGIWVAIIVLALSSLPVTRSLGNKSLRLLMPVFVISFISSLMLITGGILTALYPSLPAFRPKTEVMAFRYLSENGNSKDVVLATYSSSNALPAWTPVKVVVGLRPESVDASELTPKVNAFFRIDITDQERKNFLEEQGINFILWGFGERTLGDWNPNDTEYLLNVYQNEEYSLFSVEINDE